MITLSTLSGVNPKLLRVISDQNVFYSAFLLNMLANVQTNTEGKIQSRRCFTLTDA